jgi:hypothetical protein
MNNSEEHVNKNIRIEILQSRTLFKCEAFSAFSGECFRVGGGPAKQRVPHGPHLLLECPTSRTPTVEAQSATVHFPTRVKDQRTRQHLWGGIRD